MEIPARRKKPAPRSRSGCLECRQYHRKCDERRPVCTLCESVRRKCTYELRIRWGGRPFQKSTFGQCMVNSSASVVRVPLGKCGLKTFVYGIRSDEIASIAVSESSPNITYEDVITNSTYRSRNHTSPGQQPYFSRMDRAMAMFPDLPEAHTSLLSYFTHVADAFSCDSYVKRGICSTFLPIASRDPLCMASILNLAAIHRSNAGLSQNTNELAKLQVNTIQKLQSRLCQTLDEAVAASIIMLCYSGVVSGTDAYYSWRAHLEGAAIVFDRHLSNWTAHSQNSTQALIARCFISLAALASVSACPPSDTVTTQALRMAGDRAPTPHIDDFTAYSPEFVYRLYDIGALLHQQKLLKALPGSHLDLEAKSLALIKRLTAMISTGYATLQSPQLKTISRTRMPEYLAINESYHLAAILQIHQRIRRLPPSSPEIQALVRRTLDLLYTVKIQNGPCLGVVLFFPVFSAGCGAVRCEDRQRVRGLLGRVVEKMRFENIRQGLEVLEGLWEHRDRCGEGEANRSWDGFVAENVDIILY